MSGFSTKCLRKYTDACIRMGTVLGEGMPEKTAATTFMTNGLQGNPITPFRHSIYRPMLYADIDDICKAFEIYSKKILENEMGEKPGLSHIVNVCWPEPITVLKLAEIVRYSVIKHSNGEIRPGIEIVDRGQPALFTPKDQDLVKVNISRAKSFLGFVKMTDPRETVGELVKERLMGSS